MNEERIIIGCDQLGGSDWGTTKITEIMDALRYAYDMGFKRFDTADVYGLGLSEARLSSLFFKKSDIKITTKIGIRWICGSNWGRAETCHDDSESYVKTAIENSIKRLEGLNIETLLLHWPTSLSNLKRVIQIFEQFSLKGKFNNYGFCNGAQFLKEIQNQKYTKNLIYQTNYNLTSQNDAYIENLTKQFKSLQLYGIYAQGILAWDNLKKITTEKDDRRSRLPIYRDENISKLNFIKKQLNEICLKYNVSNSSLILNSTLRSVPEASIIVGVRHINHVKSIIEGCNLEISKKDYELIKSLFKEFSIRN